MTASWRDASRVLCVRLDNMGDVLMTTPAIRALKQRGDGMPPRHVTLLGSTAGCEIARHVPELDSVVAFDAPWVAAGREAPLRNDIASRLAAYRFDAAVIFTCYSQSALPAALMCGQAGIPLRLAHCRENPYGLLTDWVRDPEPEGGIRHEVERQLALVDAVGASTANDGLSIRTTPAARARVAFTLRGRGVDADAPYIVMHPGATAPSRRWPAERFSEVAARIVERTGFHVIVTGVPREIELVGRVVAGATAMLESSRRGMIHDFGGVLLVDEMIELIDRAALLVSNNSGPVHIAAACQTPVVDLYAQTNPQHTPWRVPHRILTREVPCANCQRSVCPAGHHECLVGVTVDDCLDAVESLLAETGVAYALSDDPVLPPVPPQSLSDRPSQGALAC